MSFKLFSFYNEFQLKIEEDRLYYYNKDGMIYGNIGKTECCGSASVYGIYANSEDILKFIKESNCSIFLFHGNYGIYSIPLSRIKDEINLYMPDVFQVEIYKQSNNEILLIVYILDIKKYNEWLTT